MKNLNTMDKISLCLIILNVIGSISFFMPPGTIWSSMFLVFIFYSIFIMWMSIPVGIVLNVISIIKKTKCFKLIWINISQWLVNKLHTKNGKRFGFAEPFLLKQTQIKRTRF